MKYKLGDTYVTPNLYNEARGIIAKGGKVFLVDALPPDESEVWSDEFRPDMCSNCHGTAAVGVQWFVGGPYSEPPPIQNNPKSIHDDTPPRLTSYQGKWYKQRTITAPCPVCDGTGSATPQARKPRKLDL